MKKKVSTLTDKQELFNSQLEYIKISFLQHLKNKKYSKNTIDLYRYKINKLILFLKDYTDITSIHEFSMIQIIQFKNFLEKMNIMPDSVLIRIKTFCQFLQDKGIISHKPFSGLDENRSRNPEALWETIPKHDNLKLHLAKVKSDFIQYLNISGLAKRTIEGYDGQINYFFYFLLNKTHINSVEDINKDIIRTYQTHLSTKLLTLNTQTRRMISVRKFCHYLFESEIHKMDVAINTKLPRKSRTLPKGILTLSQMAKILSQPDIDTPIGLRDRTIMEIFYSTGIRNQELRYIKLDDINTQKTEIIIEKGKGGKSRIVPTGDICAGFIEQYLKKARPHLVRFNPDCKYLFTSYRGGRLSGKNLGWIIKKYCEKAGIKQHITPHCFRHTCATHMLKNKASLRHIQALLGHSSIDSTRVYTRVEISDLQKVHQKCHPRGKKQSTK